MPIPNCDPSSTILQVDLDKLTTQQAVLRIKLIYTEEGSYLIFVLRNDPTKELFLTTRRERTRPKVFVDQNLLLAELHRNFPNLIFEASGNQLQSPPPASAQTSGA